jgi:hypothetical protein
METVGSGRGHKGKEGSSFFKNLPTENGKV